jgi:sugar lactone lactonase YvrE
MTTIAGSATLGAGCSGNGVPATTAQLNDPGGLAVLGADVYLADTGCHVVRRISGGMVTVVAGTLGVPGYAGEDVPATSALLDSPRAVAVDASENLYIADTNNHRVRVVSAATSRIQTFAGDGRTGFGGEGGPAVSATLPSPLAVGVDAQGNVYIADGENRRIRRVSAATLHIRTVVGNGRDVYSGDGLLGREASVGTVKGLALDAAGNLYFSAPMNLRVLVLSVVDGRVYTLAGNGSAGIPDGGAQARASPLLEPRDVAWDPTAMRLSFVDGFEGSDAPESRVLRLE